MKAYLVGGAVRDQLLGYPVHERDWVVVGSTPGDLLNQGYQQVGRDFPVFLHPSTREEYALARTERKSAPGYYGFVCDFNPHVTLEEDLARRDLTINAMAMDEQGILHDPWNGQADLHDKILRHVSAAFVDDPVRVLRVARFAARYHHLGFKIADDTLSLMYNMVLQKELSSLVPERVWQEWHRGLREKNPECFIQTLRQCGALSIVLPELDALFGIPNSRRHHPEIDTGIHTLMVLKVAVRLSDNPMIRFAALLHDLGKASTPITEWPSHRNHDLAGLVLIDGLCQRLRIPANYRKFALRAAQFHLMIHRLDELDATAIVSVLEQTDAFRRPALFEALLVVCEADACGVGRAIHYQQADHWRCILNECDKIKVNSLIKEGYQGEAIKQALHHRRIACVTHFLKLDEP